MNRLPTLDRYLYRQLVPPFVVALATMLIALLLERLLVLFNHLASAGSSLATLVSLLTDLLPHYMGLALPAALCIAVFLTIHKMSEGNEIDALAAAQVPLLRVTLPYIKVGIVLGVLSVFLYGYIQPVARYDYRQGFYFARHTGWAPHLQSKMFATTSNQTMLTADRVDHGGAYLHHVFIRDLKKDGSTQLITARKGILTISEALRSTELDLWDGQIMTIKISDTLDSPVTITHFEHVTKVIERSKALKSFRLRGEDERELTMFELIHDLRAGNDKISHRALRAEIDFRLTRALAIPFIPLIAAAFAIGQKRRRSPLGQILLAAILVGFDEILLFGHSLSAEGNASVWLTLWLPEVIFCTGCVLALLSRSQLLHWHPREPRKKATA
ncbi:LptF/LptG family permease [Acetobacteraceae bacterium ESL0709]|nr:LptF/LptG family permease [Acetobacteraceae bacterium ESL0697]MDF7678188.1 LptF/LptG family permease [Acetobacteraceae bacterium ESL0709]